MNEILQYLKTHGERLDAEIAEALGLSLAIAQSYLSELTERREIMSCHSIKFVNGKKIEGTNYRIAGFIPKAKPGAKSKVQLKLS
jgi:DeoR/GlpR family transcriptional regulator of sugar metabolism